MSKLHMVTIESAFGVAVPTGATVEQSILQRLRDVPINVTFYDVKTRKTFTRRMVAEAADELHPAAQPIHG